MMKKLGKYTLYLLLTLSVIGLVYQSISSYADGRNFPPTGNLINIGGYKLHAQKFGEGTTTVVFDAGMGDSLLAWNKVMPDISKVAKVFAYDRAGLGWSEKSPLPRTSLQVVNELHLLLDKAKVKGPLILVGHSFGGLNMQLFAKKYPENVVGLILVDSAHENEMATMPKSSFVRKMIFKAGMWAAPIGVPRLFLSLSNPAEQAVKSTIKHQYTSLDESAMFTDSMTILKATNPSFDRLPLTVIARNFSSAMLEQNKKKSLRNIEWAKLQEELAHRSLNSTLIFSGNKQHSIHRSQPLIVIDAIKDMIKKVNNKA
jgi:pimeloyl-ACP methyl ester carboxylesterase